MAKTKKKERASKVKRLVVKHGATNMVSLPKRWCFEHRLDSGSELICRAGVNKVTYFLNSEDRFYESTFHLDASAFSDTFIRHSLYNLHKAGYDHIIIFVVSQKQADLIIDLVHQELLNFEVFQEKSSILHIDKITAYSPEDFFKILTKVFHSVKVVFDHALSLLQDMSEDNYALLYSSEKHNNRLTNFAERLLSKYNYVTPGATFLYLIVWNTETLCDTIRDMAKVMESSKTKPRPSFIALFQELYSHYLEWHRLFSHYSVQDYDRLTLANRHLEKRLLDILLSNPSKPTLLYVPYLIRLCGNINSFFGSTGAYHLTLAYER